MPIFQPGLGRDPVRRESADEGHRGDDRVNTRVENVAAPPTNSSSFFSLGYGSDRDHADSRLRSSSRSPSEESIRTELCDGPVLDSPPRLSPLLARSPGHPNISSSPPRAGRADLIERLKREKGSAWIYKRHPSDPVIWSPQELQKQQQQQQLEWKKPSYIHPSESPARNTAIASPALVSTPTSSPTLLPPHTITPEKGRALEHDERRYQDGLEIERPRSALHSGDFTLDVSSPIANPSHHRAHIRTGEDPVNEGNLWIATSPPREFTPFNFERRHPLPAQSDNVRSPFSFLSSLTPTKFIYKPPTSPLFQSQSNDDTSFVSPIDVIDISSHPFRQQRRHTIFSSLSDSFGSSPGPPPGKSSSVRQEKPFPYQAHQPRRSLTTNTTFSTLGTSPQTLAGPQARRSSIGLDVSPLQHASMVGSYEESILRGRMSTTPSKPLEFLAQIGVLGLGKCKSSLRCPSHVTLPFPVVFYRYSNSSYGRSKEDDGPSPYVGQIDLENGLPNQGDDTRPKRKQLSRMADRRVAEVDAIDADHTDASSAIRDARRAQRAKRRSGSPRAPPGGSYRIPEKGQVQIIIKNPNKTAVKLFLVPYNLAGMEPGTKTFIRQRSYSNGPIIDNMPDSRDFSSTDRPILRYLVHLHICCPSRDRFYLYKSIRVVFANRVPDGKEKLQNEITIPEPKFTPYKAIRVNHPPSSNGPGASLASDTAFKRRSSGFYFGGAGYAYDTGESYATQTSLIRPLSYGFDGDHTVETSPSATNDSQTQLPIGDESAIVGEQSTRSSQISHGATQSPGNVSSWSWFDGHTDQYSKLSKGDIGYGGNAFLGIVNGNPAVAESLLSQRLKSLGVQKGAEQPGAESAGPFED